MAAEALAESPAPAPNSGWHAALQLGFRPSGEKTVLAWRQRSGPLAVQRPFYPEGTPCHVYLLHPPGGVVGGDTLDIDVRLDAQSHALLTNPGATKFYRTTGAKAVVQQRIDVADQASLEWLPQENIAFPGANVVTRTRIDLHGAARLAFWEIHCLGLPAIQQSFDQGRYDAGLQIWRDKVPLLIDRLRTDAMCRQHASLMAGQPVTATFVVTHADTEVLAGARQQLAHEDTGQAAATLIGDLLVVRYLGDSTERARKLIARIWASVREPCLARPATPPRIWAT